MSLVRRLSPREVQSSIHHNTRRAALGIALSIGALFGISAGVTAKAASEVHAAQAWAEDYLLPDKPAEQYTVMNPVAQTSEAYDNLSDAGTVSLVFGGSSIALAGMVMWRRRSTEAPGYLESDDDFGLYDFERNAFDDQEQLAEQVDAHAAELDDLEQRLAALDDAATGQLIHARVRSQLNLDHMIVLADMGGNPLDAFGYSSLSCAEQAA